MKLFEVFERYFGTPAEGSRPAPENSVAFFDLFSSFFKKLLTKPYSLMYNIHMFLENFAINVLGFIVFAPIIFLLFNWFCEQIIDMLNTSKDEWIAIGVILLIIALFSL